MQQLIKKQNSWMTKKNIYAKYLLKIVEIHTEMMDEKKWFFDGNKI